MIFEPVQWVAAREITQIPVPYQQVTKTPGRESSVQLKKKKKRGRKGSEAGSQVIRLGRSHPHRDKQNVI